MSINILHLSDIHIGNTYIPSELLEGEIENALKDYIKKIDMVAVTGDIFDGSQNDLEVKQKIKKAVDFFSHLFDMINKMQSQKIAKEDIIFIPGNHDCIKNEKGNPWGVYIDFLLEFYGKIPLQYDIDTKMIIKEYGVKKLLFLGFNTTHYDNDTDKRIEYVEGKQTRKIDELFKKKGGYSNYYKIALLHHPFYIFPEETLNQLSGTLLSPTAFQKKLAEWDVKLILHGHKHYWKEQIIDSYGTKFSVIAAGSVGKYGERKHSFDVVELHENNEIYINRISTKGDGQEFRNHFIPLKNYYKQGLLCGVLESEGLYSKTNNNAFSQIIRVINELYLNYETVNFFRYNNTTNRNLLLFSIKYRMMVRKKVSSEKLLQMSQEFYRENERGLDQDTLSAITEILKDKVIVVHKNKKEELENNQDKKKHVSFAILAAFFTDFYLDFTQYWDKQLKTILGNNREEPVNYEQVNFVGIKYDTNYKHVYVKFKCGDVESYKYAVKMVNKFRRIFYGLEEYFDCIKIKVKNFIPENVDNKINIAYYDYEASIPRLIPLLTGTNIYTSNLVFVRELIQNAIDAISFREKLNDGGAFDKSIYIDIGCDSQKRDFFKITDHGIGMKEEIIERYFTTLGRSYYKEFDYIENKELTYNSISNFGIGFLSVFRLCKKIVVETKHFRENKYYKLEIEQNQDYFLINSTEDDRFEAGTKITCYFKDEKDGDKEKICEYIRKIMQDVKYEICVPDSKNIIPSRAVRREQGTVMFIPFDEEKKDVIRIEDFNEVISGSYIEKYKHGILIRCLGGDGFYSHVTKILNAGVLIQNAGLEDFISDTEGIENLDLLYNEVVINFPPNWLQIDVSRDKVYGFNRRYIRDISKFKEKIFNEFYAQLTSCMTMYKDVSLAAISEIEEFMKKICLPEVTDINAIALNVKFKGDSILFSIDKIETGVGAWKLVTQPNYEDDKYRAWHKRLHLLFQETLTAEEFSEIVNVLERSGNFKKLAVFLSHIGLDVPGRSEYYPAILAVCLDTESKEKQLNDIDKRTRELVKRTILEKCTIGDLEKEELFSVKCDDEKLTKIDAYSEVLLQDRVKAIADDYEAESSIDKYDFIWNKIIRKLYLEYFEDNVMWEKIEREGRLNYTELNMKSKSLFTAGQNAKFNIYMIASCYMGSLLNTPDQYLIAKETGIHQNLNKYKWVWDSVIDLIFMWNLSQYKEDHDIKYFKLKDKKERRWPDEDKREKYIKLLSLNSHPDKFDTLIFSELLYWISVYREEQLLHDIG